jgi:hypothetical protein
MEFCSSPLLALLARRRTTRRQSMGAVGRRRAVELIKKGNFLVIK